MAADPRMHLFANNASGALANEISAAVTEITLVTGQGANFPDPDTGEIFKVTIDNYLEGTREICHCTARVGDVLTIERAQEGTTAVVHPAGTLVQLRITAGTIEWLQSLIV